MKDPRDGKPGLPPCSLSWAGNCPSRWIARFAIAHQRLIVAAAIEDVDDADEIIADNVGDDGGVLERNRSQSRNNVVALAATARRVADALAAMFNPIDKTICDVFASAALKDVGSNRLEIGNSLFAKNDGETLYRVAKSGSLPCRLPLRAEQRALCPQSMPSHAP